MSMKSHTEQLDDRSKRILRELISHYCLTGEPVGSRTLSKKSKMNLSPATVRNVLADLEEMEYIAQPHTSAGRVPTDKGYRFFVNHLLKNYDLKTAQKEYIQDSIEGKGGNFQDILLLTTELLARLSHNIALALTPNLEKLVLENVEFVQMANRKVLAILITKGGVVTNKVLEIDEHFSQEELSHIANYIKSEFSNHTLPAIRKRILELMKHEQMQYDRLLKKAIMLGQRTLDMAGIHEELYINGASQIVNYPEFADSDRTRDILEALEEKSKIVRILTECIEGEGIHIYIGSENRLPDFKGLTLISSPYKYQGESIGTVGILGPTRMEYGRMIPLVDHIAKVVSEILSKENS
jgi:heat-inducible transcriptional repressor